MPPLSTQVSAFLYSARTKSLKAGKSIPYSFFSPIPSTSPYLHLWGFAALRAVQQVSAFVDSVTSYPPIKGDTASQAFVFLIVSVMFYQSLTK